MNFLCILVLCTQVKTMFIVLLTSQQASSLSSGVCSESDVFGKDILNKLIPLYRLLYGH